MTSYPNYCDIYRNKDFRAHPELYLVGKGEQGVLMAEPYKSEILPFWRFKTPEIAYTSSRKIYQMFLDYLAAGDFVGADMARKFLMMGWTRARRYANHRSGRKYDKKRTILPQEEDALTNQKAQSAKIFRERYLAAWNHPEYQTMLTEHLTAHG